MENKEWKSIKEFFCEDIDKGVIRDEEYRLRLGKFYSFQFASNIKRMSFSLSRYKFVAKLLSYEKRVRVIEFGCQEAIGGIILKQELDLEKYLGIDFDSEAIEWNRQNLSEEFEFIEEDFFSVDISDIRVNAVFALDVIEHIEGSREDEFILKMCNFLDEDGMAIVGTPNISMDPYASAGSKLGHINLYDQKRLYELMNKYFRRVFIFGMNDEIVHTGFEPMCCYIFAVGICPRNQ